jgi:hypothetical protein
MAVDHHTLLYLPQNLHDVVSVNCEVPFAHANKAHISSLLVSGPGFCDSMPLISSNMF